MRFVATCASMRLRMLRFGILSVKSSFRRVDFLVNNLCGDESVFLHLSPAWNYLGAVALQIELWDVKHKWTKVETAQLSRLQRVPFLHAPIASAKSACGPGGL
jgi:hypothetical protein